MEGLRPSIPPPKLYRCGLSGFAPPDLSEKLYRCEISGFVPPDFSRKLIFGIFREDSERQSPSSCTVRRSLCGVALMGVSPPYGRKTPTFLQAIPHKTQH
jgi:hypothetical protein